MEHTITIGVFLSPDEYSRQGYHRVVTEIADPNTWHCPREWLEIGRFTATITYSEYDARARLVQVLANEVNTKIGELQHRAEIITARLSALPEPQRSHDNGQVPKTSEPTQEREPSHKAPEDGEHGDAGRSPREPTPPKGKIN